MQYIQFDQSKPYDLILLGRVAVDFNPVDYYCPLNESTTFKRYLGGSPANIAVGLTTSSAPLSPTFLRMRGLTLPTSSAAQTVKKSV